MQAWSRFLADDPQITEVTDNINVDKHVFLFQARQKWKLRVWDVPPGPGPH